MLVQSSLAELKALRLYDRYCSLIDPLALAEITEHVGPGWMPVSLAIAHYRACDALGLDSELLDSIGAHGGEKVASTLLVTSAKGAAPSAEVYPWLAVDAFWRMGRRVCEGSSSQYVKLGPKRLSIESIGNPLQAIHYYRAAHIGFLRSAFSTLGARVSEIKVVSFDPLSATTDTRISWL